MYRVILSADDYTLPWKEKKQWLIDNLGYSEDEARDVVYALEGYTDRGYHDIHIQDFSGYGGESRRKDAQDIDKLLNHPKMPRYHGTLYRGLIWEDYKLGDIENVLNKGIWKEPGITSFSTDRDEIDKFAAKGTFDISVYITLKNSKSGCEVGFLSSGGGEGEVLIPSNIATKGFKIIDWDKTSKLRDRRRKDGSLIKTIEYDIKYFITCTE